MTQCSTVQQASRTMVRVANMFFMTTAVHAKSACVIDYPFDKVQEHDSSIRVLWLVSAQHI